LTRRAHVWKTGLEAPADWDLLFADAQVNYEEFVK